jgi:hypothetical protein
MKILLATILLLTTIYLKAQQPVWENFSSDQVQHPFITEESREASSRTWKNDGNYLYEIYNNETLRKFDTRPANPNISKGFCSAIKTSGTGEVAFVNGWYDLNLKKTVWSFGFFDGENLQMYPESTMNLKESERYFYNIGFSRNNIWISYSDGVTKFNKQGEFTHFYGNKDGISGTVSYPILLEESNQIMIHNKTEFYRLSEDENSFINLIPGDSVKLLTRKPGTTFNILIGKNSIYKYRQGELKKWNKEKSASCSWQGFAYQFTELNSSIIYIPTCNGFILLEGDKKHEVTEEKPIMYSDDAYVQDNGIIVSALFINGTGTKVIYTLNNSEITKEGYYPSDYLIYKTGKGDITQFHFSSFNMISLKPEKMEIISSQDKSVTIAFPQQINRFYKKYIDANYIWIKNDSMEFKGTEFEIFRLKYNSDGEITGTSDQWEKLSNVHPNPANEKIRISMNNLYRTEIFDLEGQRVYSGNSAETEVSHLPEGIYILRAFDQDSKILHTEKFVIQR